MIKKEPFLLDVSENKLLFQRGDKLSYILIWHSFKSQLLTSLLWRTEPSFSKYNFLKNTLKANNYSEDEASETNPTHHFNFQITTSSREVPSILCLS